MPVRLNGFPHEGQSHGHSTQRKKAWVSNVNRFAHLMTSVGKPHSSVVSVGHLKAKPQTSPPVLGVSVDWKDDDTNETFLLVEKRDEDKEGEMEMKRG